MLTVATLLVSFSIDGGPGPVRGSVVLGLAYGEYGFIFTFWLTIPIGTVSGWIHEQAVTEY